MNYSVEDGLIQSQALHICQDKYRQLWISTEGGLSKFDGKKFTGYSVQDGLSSNRIGDVFCDADGNIWAGTEFGLSVFNGNKFKHIRLGKSDVNNVGAIVQAADKKIYAINNYKLYCVDGDKAVRIKVSPDSIEDITIIFKTNTNDLLVFIYGKGLFAQKGETWNKVAGLGDESNPKYFRTIYITHYDDTLFTSSIGLFSVKNKKIVPQYNVEIPPGLNVYSVTEDSRKNLWLGTDNGAYKISREGFLHFDSKNGFTDNTVFNIYKDVENNLWFATDADGIFNFRENTFTYYDKSSGMSNPIIMGIVETKSKNIFLAGYGGGLFRINSKGEIESVKLDNPQLRDSKINSLYADDKENIWIGTLGKGAWKYNEKEGLKKIEGNSNGVVLRGGTCFLKDKRGNLLIGNAQGLFLYDAGQQISRIKIPAALVSSLKQLDDNTIVIGTSNGLYFLDKNYTATPVNKKGIIGSSILCLDVKNNHVWMGTTDRGLLSWDLKSGKITNYNTASGLPSNFIYSLYVSDKQAVWAGTGFGISNIYLSDSGTVRAVKNYGRAEGLLGMECNHNSVLCASDSGLWFGTTKGLFHFNPYSNPDENIKPFVLLKSVKLFSSLITDSTLCNGFDNWFGTPRQLKLKAGQNHLTFELGGVYFTNPDAMIYKYKLEGIDADYVTSVNPVIIYASLPPGKYALKVTAITQSGIQSVNTIEYPFEIEKAFYQTGFFQLFIVLLLISSGALVVFVTSRRKQKRKEVLEKIREEEFMKLRHRTAEDFHDEVGNKLTRISVLADILKSKIGGTEAETVKIVSQIKENTNALYSGSRDIIWSLNPQNDGIFEITEHIKEIGAALFDDTKVEFNFSHNLTEQRNEKLKLDYSRNLIMTFKEIYNNILKHSGAQKVSVDFVFEETNGLHIKVIDNGRGFNSGTEMKGNGLKNISNRVKRMNGECEIKPEPGKGAEITIILKNVFA
ncbi:MAG TPA: two-component regulator propeller domain-containing protein [Bacteroidia bacterium]|nr:two-component regulator propeller domain-containing protein [Bacteroidia bacterium]